MACVVAPMLPRSVESIRLAASAAGHPARSARTTSAAARSGVAWRLLADTTTASKRDTNSATTSGWSASVTVTARIRARASPAAVALAPVRSSATTIT